MFHKDGGKVGSSGPQKAENLIKRLLLLVLGLKKKTQKNCTGAVFYGVEVDSALQNAPKRPELISNFRVGLGIPVSRIRDFKSLSCEQCFSRVLCLKPLSVRIKKP